MAGVAASLLVTAVADSVAPLSALRLIGGLAGAFTFISGSALVASLFEEDPQARAVAISAFFAGGGAGMLLCGLVIPPLVAGCDTGSWRLGWTFLGVASALATILSVRTLRGVFSARSETTYGRADGVLQVRRMTPALFSYFLFALGYLVYLTFIVARAERAGMGNTGTMALWSIMSVAMIAAPFLWRRAIVGYGHGAMVLAASIALTGAASVLPSLSGHQVPLLASAALFGIAVFTVPSAVTAFCRANLARSEWQRSIGLFTLVFAIGQTIGPFAAGWVGDVSGNLSLPFLGASLVLGCAAAIACLQRSLRPLG
jgi:predicted MFS family arabinose efflux permease